MNTEVVAQSTTDVVEKKIPNDSKNLIIRPPVTLVEYVILRSPLLRHISRRILTLRQVMLISDGRDKVLKVFQYFSKAMLWASDANNREKGFKYTENVNAMIAQFSITRKLLRLFHVTDPINKIYNIPLAFGSQYDRQQRIMATIDIIDGFVCFANDIVDDIICLSKIGVIDKDLAKKYSPYSARLWMTGIWLDYGSLYQRMVATNKAIEESTTKEDVIKYLSEKNRHYYDFIKLTFDLIFCIGDCWPQAYKSAGVQAISGSISGFMV
ncbi:hypothetical protein BCR36DRAFT_299535 [Piromyces finnis]|uniref:Uncharacterized protein n=1 Tax=Piromyces finnis TaxID=1754191 RepID=A0A1Y1V272_9FUNG|nr:hypothetical protein BCR36DRAFT_299535 [Piromyces finnis]|eukprot:ORX45404.1 hypothetical protein BCR36DRAFT_299535 [Piromyces finnis]